MNLLENWRKLVIEMDKILNDLKTIAGFFIFPIFVLATHFFLLLFFNIYEVFPWFDIPMHFLGGMAVSITYFLILGYLQKENYLRINSSIKIIFVFALVSLTAVFWEFFEFSLEYLTGLGLQGDLNDTMLDLFLGIFGGLLAVIFLENNRSLRRF